MLQLVRGVDAEWFKPHEDNDFEIKIKPLDAVQFLNITSMLSGLQMSGNQTIQCLVYGAVDWKNASEDFSVEALRKLPGKTMVIVAKEIMDRSTLSDDEVKNY